MRRNSEKPSRENAMKPLCVSGRITVAAIVLLCAIAATDVVVGVRTGRTLSVWAVCNVPKADIVHCPNFPVRRIPVAGIRFPDGVTTSASGTDVLVCEWDIATSWSRRIRLHADRRSMTCWIAAQKEKRRAR